MIEKDQYTMILSKSLYKLRSNKLYCPYICISRIVPTRNLNNLIQPINDLLTLIKPHPNLIIVDGHFFTSTSSVT